jgi:hypothetical protein
MDTRYFMITSLDVCIQNTKKIVSIIKKVSRAKARVKKLVIDKVNEKKMGKT